MGSVNPGEALQRALTPPLSSAFLPATAAPPTLPDDPNLAAEQARAQNDLVDALQVQTQGDMASLMARYGTHLALAGSNALSPLMAPSTAAR